MSFENSVAMNAKVANSPEAEIARLKEELGFSKPDTSLKQAEYLVEQAQKTPAPVAAPTGEDPSLLDTAAAGAKFVGKAVVGAAKGIADTVTEGIPAMAKNPKQALAGAGDMLSNISDAGWEAVNAFESWRAGNGFKWEALPEVEQADIGGMIAPQPVTEEERRARDTAKFLSQFTAFIGASVASGGAAGAYGLGATGVTAAASASGGAVGFLAFDPNEDGIAELAQKDPALRNWLIDWFAGDENDSAFEGRMKNALGAVMGDVVIGGALFGIAKIAKSRRLLRAKVKGAEPPPAAGVAGVADDVMGSNAAPLADDSTLAKAEVQNADNIAAQVEGAPAPDLPPKTAKGKPFGAITEEAADRSTKLADEVRYGPLSEDEFVRLSKVSNKVRRELLSGEDPAAIAQMDSIKGLEEIKGKVVDTDSQVRGALKILKDPEEFQKLQMFRSGGANPNNYQAKAIVIMEKLHEAVLEEAANFVDALVEKKAPANVIADAEARFGNAFNDWQYWLGFREGTGSGLGSALQAMKDLGVEKGMKDLKSIRWSADVRNFTIGDSGKTRNLAKIIKNMPEGGGPVKHADGVLQPAGLPDKLAKAISTVSGKVVDVVQNVYIQSLLSGFNTLVINPVSGGINILARQAQRFTAKQIGKVFGSQFKMSDELFKKYFPNVNVSKLDDAGKAALYKEIDAIENFHNVRRVNPDIEKAFDAANDISTIKDIILDSFYLKALASDNKFIPNSSAKIGSIVRSVTEEQLVNMSFGDRLKYIASQFKNKPLEPVTTTMALQDAMVGNIEAVINHRVLARKYALSNATDALHAQTLYKEVMNSPPKWMQDMVTQGMEEVNFAAAFDKSVSPALHHIEKAINKVPGARAFVPFLRVSLNALDQAVQHSTLAMLSGRFRAAMAEGGYARQMALAKVANGHAVFAAGGALTGLGIVVGAAPRNPTARAAWQAADPNKREYSIKIGDSYIPLQAWQGLGAVFKFAADAYDIATYVPKDSQAEYDRMMLTGIAVVADFFDPDFLVDETAKIADVLRKPDTKSAQKYLATKWSAPIGIARSITRMQDPTKRDISPVVDDERWDTFEIAWNNFKSHIPGLSGDLPAQRDLWGKAQVYSLPGHGPENTSPLAFSENPDKSVEKEIFRLGMSGPLYDPDPPPGEKYLMITKMPRYITREGVQVPLNPQQYDDLSRLAGGDYTVLAEHKFMTAKDAERMSKNDLHTEMKEMLNSDYYKKATDQVKRDMIKERINFRRAAAKEFIFQLYPELLVKQSLGKLDQMKASTPDPAQKAVIENQKQQLIRTRGEISL
jgi:hypothetical protein